MSLMNVATVFAAIAQSAWNRSKILLLRDTVVLPALGFLGIIALWWIVALFRRDLMPTPPEEINTHSLGTRAEQEKR